MPSEVFVRYQAILKTIQDKLCLLGRQADATQLVAVSKTHPVEVLQQLSMECEAAGAGVTFGENYIQEFKRKKERLPSAIDCHFIGHLQRNKAKDAVKLFTVIESIDSAELAIAVNKEAAKIGKVQEVYLQVNVSEDTNKGGFSASELTTFIHQSLPELDSLRATGLMTITALYDNPEQARPDFMKLRILRDTINPKFALSMGMSSDYLVAIEEGATVVRVGTAIFGERAKE